MPALELTNGYSFAFPITAIDVSVPGLLLSALGVEERLRHLASLAGRVSTDAKARAARANGRKGGRPRKRTSKRKAKSG